MCTSASPIGLAPALDRPGSRSARPVTVTASPVAMACRTWSGITLVESSALDADALAGDEPRVLPVGAGEVDEPERAVRPRLGQHAQRRGHGLRGAAVHRPGQAAQLLEDAEPAGGEHPLRRLDDGVDQARHLPAGLEDGAEREGEVGLLLVPVPAHHQREVLGVGRAAGEHLGGHAADVVPDVAPDLGGPAPERRGVPVAQERGVGVVVDHDQLGAPHEQDRGTGCSGRS